eukprot:3565935-Prorocentrum_lima.AAC.1
MIQTQRTLVRRVLSHFGVQFSRAASLDLLDRWNSAIYERTFYISFDITPEIKLLVSGKRL